MDSLLQEDTCAMDTLLQGDARGVFTAADGTVVEFYRQGVIDLFTLVTEQPELMHGGKLADRVIGRGAAHLLVKGKVAEVYGRLMSEPALEVLHAAGINASYSTLCPNIINRKGDGICPVEALTANVTDADEAYQLIQSFIKSMNK